MVEHPNSRTATRRPIPPGAQMGAPPAWAATAGRANPPGISYLYAADEEATAIAEVRPFIGASVSVARVEARETVTLVDAGRVRSVLSTMLHNDLSDVLKAFCFLELLNEQLSRPITPNTADTDYLPTQYLAEVIRAAGYDGIRYRSAVAENGTNFVIFDQEKTMIFETKLVDVSRIQVAYRDATRYGQI